jgi:hypothetical protein
MMMFFVLQWKHRQLATFNQIWSARLNIGILRQLVQASPGFALECHGNPGWQLVTAEQQRPSDDEMMRSLSNRQPLLRKRDLGVLEPSAHRNPQKINANVYSVTQII